MGVGKYELIAHGLPPEPAALCGLSREHNASSDRLGDSSAGHIEQEVSRLDATAKRGVNEGNLRQPADGRSTDDIGCTGDNHSVPVDTASQKDIPRSRHADHVKPV